jgi:hypothetical protein
VDVVEPELERPVVANAVAAGGVHGRGVGLETGSVSGLPDFSWYKIPKR